MTTLDLTRIPAVRRLLVNRWPQFILRVLALVGFLLAILAGFWGTPAGSRNFGIVVVWIGWWALLILIAVPLLGRGWCSICPIPLAGEWLQQGTLLGPNDRSRGWGLGRKWPRRLRHIWLQNGAFLLLALFSAVVLTSTTITAVLLTALFAIATATALIFERRAFCRYLCPVGGFIGLYAQTAPLEVRVRDTAVCAGHTTKTCYTGNGDGYGCPWNVFPGGLVKNTNCGTCLECLRTCPHDNIAIQIRPFGADLTQQRSRRLDEAYKAFIMLGSAAVYAAVLLGPWGQLKTAAYNIGTLPWFAYVVFFLIMVVGVVPGLFWLATTLGRQFGKKKRSPKQVFITFAYALIPLGLTAWIAFSLSFVLTNASYLWPVLSDPLGWGWNLWGTRAVDWTPYLSGIVPLLQSMVLLLGLGWSSRTALQLARELTETKTAIWAATPVIIFCFLITVGFLWLLV